MTSGQKPKPRYYSENPTYGEVKAYEYGYEDGATQDSQGLIGELEIALAKHHRLRPDLRSPCDICQVNIPRVSTKGRWILVWLLFRESLLHPLRASEFRWDGENWTVTRP